MEVRTGQLGYALGNERLVTADLLGGLRDRPQV
jgi:hypothetical protein